MARLSLDTRVRLNNGVEMPLLGLGTFQMGPGQQTREAVLAALKLGYRLIDTAALYENEADVGEAVRRSGIRRDEIFITTKLWNTDHGYERAIAACEKSLKLLGLPQVDLYLIHWPVQKVRADSWRALQTLLHQGKCRAIGVSNYMLPHMTELLATTTTVPAVDQVEFSPFLYHRELLEFCRSKNIQLESYSPLTKGTRLDDPRLAAVAARHGRSTAQILIRWTLQHGVVAIPKAVHPRHLSENAAVFDFELSPSDMKALDSLNEELHTGWDPTRMP